VNISVRVLGIAELARLDAARPANRLRSEIERAASKVGHERAAPQKKKPAGDPASLFGNPTVRSG
jgi:hypothetical protein